MSDKKIRVAINGAGRIGRAFLKLSAENKNIDVVAVNDLGSVENIAYLLKYDSAYGKSSLDVGTKGVGDVPKKLIINGKEIDFLSEKDPKNLPWKDLDIDVVVESTGFFTSYEKSQAHIDAGAKRVVISAPVKEKSQKTNGDAGLKDELIANSLQPTATTNGAGLPRPEGLAMTTTGEESLRLATMTTTEESLKSTGMLDIPDYRAVEGHTVLMGINDDKLKLCKISSNASCTTNASSPVLEILRNTVGIEKAMLNTVHGYTATQKLVDSPDAKDFRKGRAGAQNIIPSTTGAAVATTLAIEELKGVFDGIAVRVPVISGSLVDITFVAKRNTTADEINKILKEASQNPRWDGIFTVTTEPIVSSDIVGDTHASIADLSFTRVVGGNLVKVLAWYDNEMGYTNALVKHVLKAGESLS